MAGGGHALDHRHLHVPGHSTIHRMAPEAKLVATLCFVSVVALTPRRSVGAFAVDAAVVAAVVAVSRLSLTMVLQRLTVILPFVLFAVFVPLVAGGEQTEIAGVSLSIEGLWSTWNILAKSVLGASASIVLSATTPIPDLLRGLSRLKIPAAVIAIIAFMFRYLELLADQLTRMRRSMVARCHDPRWLWQAKPIATSAGALFVRSYERGERIHQAMLARGYTGTMPTLDPRRGERADWVMAALPAIIAAIGAITVWVVT